MSRTIFRRGSSGWSAILGVPWRHAILRAGGVVSFTVRVPAASACRRAVWRGRGADVQCGMASDLPDFDTLACLDRSWRISDLDRGAQRAHGASRRRSSTAAESRLALIHPTAPCQHARGARVEGWAPRRWAMIHTVVSTEIDAPPEQGAALNLRFDARFINRFEAAGRRTR